MCFAIISSPFDHHIFNLNNSNSPYRKTKEFCSLALYIDVRNINGGIPDEFLDDVNMLDIYIKSALKDTRWRINNRDIDPYWKNHIGPNYWTGWWNEFSRDVIDTYFRDILGIKSEHDLLNNKDMLAILDHVNDFLEFIPPFLRTPKVCMAGLKRHPTYLQYCSGPINTCILDLRDKFGPIRTLQETALIHYVFSNFTRRKKQIPIHFMRWITRPLVALEESMRTLLIN